MIGVGELAADDGALAVAQKGRELRQCDQVFWIHGEIGARLDGELWKEVLGILVDAGEPGGVRHGAHAVDGADLVAITEWQMKDQRDRVARHKPRRRRALRAGVPGVHDRLQQPERQDRYDQSEQRERGAQSVAQRVAEDELQELHRTFTSATARAHRLPSTARPYRDT